MLCQKRIKGSDPQDGRKCLQIICLVYDLESSIQNMLYKEHLLLNNKKTSILIKKLVKDLNRHFSKEGIQMTIKHIKRCSTSLIKTTVRHHFTLTRLAKIKKSMTIVDENVEKLEPSYIAGRSIKWCRCVGKQFVSSSKVKYRSYHMIRQFHSQIYTQEN